MNGNLVFAVLRLAEADAKIDKVRPTIEEAARTKAATREPWWAWSAWLAAGISLHRIRALLATGKDPFRS